MEIKANGQLRHHFWGDYAATIALEFANEVEAAFAKAKLVSGWTVAKNSPRALIWHGGGGDFAVCKAELVKLGADENKIASMRFSVDYGEKFDIVMEVDDPKQLKLI